MGKPGEVKWEEWMSILQPINRGAVEDKLEEKVPFIEPIDEKVVRDAITISPGPAVRAAESEEVGTDESTDTSEASTDAEPVARLKESHVTTKAAEL